ncbi:hypothetical protein B7494_g2846 [Chlorociboria aeruginascens]|nr:hypothetical protein B7494_g2846 [Chlorociboria aeruginascens]
MMPTKLCIIPIILAVQVLASNSTYKNPILPGFHPDPSCIFVPEWDDTFFCASSSFLVFPGIPIHASRDLLKWKLVSNALSRPEQLPVLNTTKGATSGIWASTLRYRNGIFYLITTHVFDQYPQNSPTRFINLIFTSKDPYESTAWSQPIQFNFTGYDTSPFWDDDGKLYITGTHEWETQPGIQMFTLDVETGNVGDEIINLWNGTGGIAPEGPHLYKKDGYYYLLIAEGGTGAGHMANVARSRHIHGPYESDPQNPVLTNANTTAYFQNVGHADLFQDSENNWWAVALSVRQGPDGSYPMGRETSLTPVKWEEGEWPIFTNVSGNMNSWHLNPAPQVTRGEGSLVTSGDDIKFEPGFSFPPHLVNWRFPVVESYVISAPGHPNTLQLTSSIANITGRDGRSAEPGGQTFIGRRQVDSFFTYSTTFDISALSAEEQEVGVTVFLDQLHHWDLGAVLLMASNGTSLTANLRLRGITTVPTFVFPDLAILPIPTAWLQEELTLEIKTFNLTHYAFSAGPAGKRSLMQTVGYAPGLGLTWGFTGALLGIYATTNGGTEEFRTYVSDWKYIGEGQVVE